MRAKDRPIGVDQCNCFTVRKAARQISRLYDSYLQPSGLRITQFLILATLNERESASVNVLSERLDIERTAMGKMIGVLERDGLVAVRPSPEDGRIRIVELTPEGTKLFERAAPLWREAQREFSVRNGARNVEVLRRSLSGMKVGGDSAPVGDDE
ncbi:MAG: Transcriptional regulator, MarR family [uncultured Paraburkholderia sp.]|nr:MAG: Transcriptional regulator, MarR family [uncultured Paraburkholderia sp.]CAH2783495.1 MAG: Transcriptional regulator, MarR family [uncultured Paraburkholderia sp.]CAH2917606.1 MAG: Transcriptional regulator, MarR family [uncultured Paraburkholderia sp.]CAH2918754.1 MAG: Transcriptional regulator, MarR family [uncultured Paraburkholderia sp.]